MLYRKPERPVISPRHASSLGEKMVAGLLRHYVRSRLHSNRNNNNNNNDDHSGSCRWQDVEKAAQKICASSPIHTEPQMKAAVRFLTETFPTLPRDAPQQRIESLLTSVAATSSSSSSSSSASAAAAAAAADSLMVSAGLRPSPRKPAQNGVHPFDTKACERLSSQAMFPPLQKVSPRSTSSQTRFSSNTANHHVQEEQRLATKIRVHRNYVVHHFGKGNAGSTRRKRNMTAIHLANSSLHTGEGGGGGNQEQEEAQHEAGELLIKALNNSNKGSQRLTAAQVAAATSRRSRFGLNFTQPEELEGTNDELEKKRYLLMTDELMDKLQAKEKQRQTRVALDREVALRQREREAKKRQEDDYAVVDRETVARAVAVENSDAIEARKKQIEHQKNWSEELKRAERRRQERNQAAAEEKERYATFARDQMAVAEQEERVREAAKRKKREETSHMNEVLAAKREKMKKDERAREQLLEREEEELYWSF